MHFIKKHVASHKIYSTHTRCSRPHIDTYILSGVFARIANRVASSHTQENTHPVATCVSCHSHNTICVYALNFPLVVLFVKRITHANYFAILKLSTMLCVCLAQSTDVCLL